MGEPTKKATVLKTVDERTPEEKKAFDDLTELADQLLRYVWGWSWGGGDGLVGLEAL